MALDYISEPDNIFIADNLLSSEDWGDPGFYGGENFDDLTDVEEFNSRLEACTTLTSNHGLLCDDLSDDTPSSDLTSDDLSTVDLARAWLEIADEKHLGDTNGDFGIKNEPLSPPPSSESSESSNDSSQASRFLQNGTHNHIHVKLESPPLTPPRDPFSDSPSPLGGHQTFVAISQNGHLPNGASKSLANGVANRAKKGVAIAPKPRNGVRQLPLAPKLEPLTATISIQSPTKPTVTVKQIPARPPIVVKQNTPSVFSTANGTCGPPPAKQAKVIPASHQTSVPSPPQPVAMVTQTCPLDVDVKVWKRQQRMIKNRESACLSRKKKKEYLQELESKAQDLENEIARLRSENTTLRNRVEGLVKENTMLKKMQSSVFSSPARTATCLLAIVFIIGFNLAPISLFSQSNVISESETTHHVGRALLGFAENSSHMTPQDYSESTSRLSSAYTNVMGDARLWQSVANQSQDANGVAMERRKDIQYLLSLSNFSCPHQMNVSETIRLTDVLEFWAMRQSVEQKKSKEKQHHQKKRRRQPPYRHLRSGPALHVESDERALQLYDHLFQKSYDNLLDALNRRDDTFYIVSFRKDHLLLPATAHNNTHRPKMSLVMPTVSGNESMWSTPKDHISMMQIDCEVVDTRIVHVKDHAAPRPVVVNETSYASGHPPVPTNNRGGEGLDSQTGATGAYVGMEVEHKLGYHPRNVTSTSP